MKERRKKMNRKYKLNNNTAKKKNLTTIRKQKKLNICLICSVCTLLTNKIRCKYVINCDIFRLQRQRTTN